MFLVVFQRQQNGNHFFLMFSDLQILKAEGEVLNQNILDLFSLKLGILLKYLLYMYRTL